MTTASPAHPRVYAWVAAVHATEHDHKPLGAAVVIDSRRILTCAHVVLDSGGEVRRTLWVSFPMSTARERRLIGAVDLAYEKPVRDVAVLTLDADVPAGAESAPMRCPQPSDMVGERWWAFGFPDGDPQGDSADGVVGSVLAYGWLRLDTTSRYVIAPGFSGGGLWSPQYKAVVGLVGQAHSNGDGRAVTLHEADLCLPHQKLVLLSGWSVRSAGDDALAAWGWSLAQDAEGVRHWRPRARGVSIDSERGHRFRGRPQALTEITGWLDRPHPDHRVLVVTGSPGVGKSAVLGRIITTADKAIRASLPPDDDSVKATLGSVACAVHAKGKTALDVATEIARAASAALPGEPGDLAPAIRQALRAGNRRFSVIIDALDEAASPDQARAVIAQIVLPLTETCADVGAQVVVGTRRNDGEGSLLAEFGRALAAIDLDERTYFAQSDLAAYALACLQLAGNERAGSPYSNTAIARPLAARIAALSDRNFLIAGMVARDHGLHDQQAVHPERIEFDASVETVLTGYLDRAGSAGGLSANQVLTALAFAESPGLPASLWQLFVEALYDHPIAGRELTEFARTTAANFLIETGTDGSAEPVFRLYHQALNDTLLHRRGGRHPNADDQRDLARILIAHGRRRGWRNAEPYLLRSLPAHAGAPDLIDEVLGDVSYLLYADLQRLVLHTRNASSPAAARSLQTIGLTPQAFAAPAGERAALFSVSQALEYGQVSYGHEADVPYLARWAHAQGRGASVVLEGHQGGVNAVCPVTVDGQPRLASGSNDRTVRIWDPATGRQTAVLHGYQRVVTVCPVTVADQPSLAATGSYGPIWIWNPATCQRTAVRESLQGTGNALCPITVEGQPLLASGGNDQTIRIWDPAHGEQITFLEGHQEWVNAVCPVTVAGQPRLASASDDRTIRIWNPADGQQTAVLEGHQRVVNAVCPVTVEGQPRLASASDDRTIRIWDPADGRQTAVLEGRQGTVRAVCPVTVEGQLCLASANDDRMVQIWDPVTGEQISVLERHQERVNAVCPVTVEGQPRLASASDDRTIRIWDPATGQQTAVLEGHQRWVNAVCPVTVGGQPRLASASYDETVRIWDPATGQQTAILEDHQGAVRAVCPVTVAGLPRLASASNDRTIRIWNPATGQQTAVLEGHQDLVNAVCPIIVAGQPRLASASNDRTIRIWNPATGQQTAVLEGHQDLVNAVCPIIVAGQPRLASAGADETVRIWDPTAPGCRLTIPLHYAATSISWMEDALAVGLSGGVLVIDIYAADF